MSTTIDDNPPAGKGDGTDEGFKKCDVAALFERTNCTADGERYIATLDRRDNPTHHHKGPSGQRFPDWASEFVAGKAGAYFTPATFRPGALVGSKGRTAANALEVNSTWADIEGSVEKGGYAGGAEVLKAARGFAGASGLVPNFIVSTGSGGAHLYWCFATALTPAEWLPRARALVALCSRHGLKIDAPCTTDIARIMRAPGSVHQGAGNPVVAAQWRVEPYTLAEFDQLIGFDLTAVPRAAPATGSTLEAPPVYAVKHGSKGINADALHHDTQPPADADLIADNCAAMAGMRDTKGCVPEPHWRAMLGVLKFCKDGEDKAHEWSSGDPRYSRDETQRKLDKWDTGPTTCAHVATVTDKCEGCPHRGKITSSVQLGRVARETAPATVGDTQTSSAIPSRTELEVILPDWDERIGRSGRREKFRPQATVANIQALADRTGWDISFNVMTRRAELTRPGVIVPGDDADNTALTLFGDIVLKAGISLDRLPALVNAAAQARAYHPAVGMIESRAWDGVSRRQLLRDSLELADPTKQPLADALTDAWMLQAVGALKEPTGLEAQGMLVLAGAQGCGKTRWVGSLGAGVPDAVRLGLHVDPSNKDSVFAVTGAWITELGELDHTTRRADVGALKAFITRREDVMRRPYAPLDVRLARRTVLVGTVNESGFLHDTSGNRRFWTIEVARCTPIQPDDMQQIWAEYMARYRNGERWHLDAETRALLNASNQTHTAIDPIEERICGKFDWASVDWAAAAVAAASGERDWWRTVAGVAWRSATDICIDVQIDRPTRLEATRASAIVRKQQRTNGVGEIGGPIGGPTTGICRLSAGVNLWAVPSKRQTAP